MLEKIYLGQDVNGNAITEIVETNNWVEDILEGADYLIFNDDEQY